MGRIKMRKNGKPAHGNRTIERHLNYQIGVESVFGANTKFKGVSAQFCEDYLFGVWRGVGERRGSPQDSEASIRTFRGIGFGLATDNRSAIVCMSHFCPLESQNEKHKS
jgi:hypothetical protein